MAVKDTQTIPNNLIIGVKTDIKNIAEQIRILKKDNEDLKERMNMLEAKVRHL